MGGKAKPTKHTSAEISKKTQLATQNAGGGGAGLSDRLGGKAGHAKLECTLCGVHAPDLKSMQFHHEAKHPKVAFDPAVYPDLHEIHGGSTQGVAVRGGKRTI
jgi:hypothetical protein